MSTISSFTIERPAGTPIATGVDCQLDNITVMVAPGSGGAVPYNSYMLISLSGPIDIANGDLLLDEVNVDAKGNPVQYRVSGNTEQFDDHSEVMVTKNVQVTP